MMNILYLIIFFFALYGVMAFLTSWWVKRDAVRSYRPFTTILLIVKNKEEVIEGIIRHILFLKEEYNPDFELLVIDNLSSDKTPLILKKLSDDSSSLKYINMKDFPDAYPVETAMNYVKGEVICCFDLQKRVNPRFVTRAVKSILHWDCIKC